MRSRASQRLALSLLVLSASAASLAQELRWPQPSMPQDTQYEDAGQSVHFNGVPLRALRFRSNAPAEEVKRIFAEGIDGKPTRVTAMPGAPGEWTMGGRQGDFWLTLRWREEGERTAGTWSAAPVFNSEARRPVVLPQGFPSTAMLFQQIDSYDIDKRSQLAVGMDTGAVDAVAARLEEEMRGAGYKKQPQIKRSWVTPQQYVAVFSRTRDEIYVTLKQEHGGTSVVINRISALEKLQ